MANAADETRARLLAAAGPLFAQHGYRDASVKDICAAANCNVAAISYHFGSKQEFYGAVLADAHRATFARESMPATGPEVAAEDAFAAWLRWWMGSLLRPDRPVWLPTMMAREMVDPTPALDHMVENAIRPMYERLSSIVRRLLGVRPSPAVVRACTVSVIGQVFVHKHAAPVLLRLGALPPATARGVAQRIDHVITFSLAGIQAIARGERSQR